MRRGHAGGPPSAGLYSDSGTYVTGRSLKQACCTTRQAALRGERRRLLTCILTSDRGRSVTQSSGSVPSALTNRQARSQTGRRRIAGCFREGYRAVKATGRSPCADTLRQSQRRGRAVVVRFNGRAVDPFEAHRAAYRAAQRRNIQPVPPPGSSSLQPKRRCTNRPRKEGPFTHGTRQVQRRGAYRKRVRKARTKSGYRRSCGGRLRGRTGSGCRSTRQRSTRMKELR